ncbi:MAG TPA: dihydrofolate reductase family protein [Streptosporangiaceae bacterium]|nr:dihydrofolate reductase family protein [Streptosporangiaceae bacterium]
MGRLIVSARMTADAVMDQIEGWFDPKFEGGMAASWDELMTADALLLGRETYTGLSGAWPTMTTDPEAFAHRMNAMPKYVASRTLKPPLRWNATLIEGDVVERVAELKREHTGNLLSCGCGELAGELARHGLVDEVRFWLYPVVWGDGVRPFHAGRLPVRLRLIGTTTFSSGVVRLSYEPAEAGP